MTKQIINSFKELQSLVADVKLTKEPTARKSFKNQPGAKAKPRQVQTKIKIRQSGKTAQKTKSAPRSVDPKMQVIFDSLTWLKETFPNAFFSPPTKITALKIGIGHDIIEYVRTLDNVPHSLTSIRKALSVYTHNFRYLTASAKMGNPRIDLQGNVVGQVSKEQADYAHEKLNALKLKQMQRTSPAAENQTDSDDALSESKP